MLRCRILLLFLVLCAPLPAAADLLPPLTESEKQAFGENYLLPSPAEVFLALEKAGPVDWTAMASFNPRYTYDSNTQRALNLGVRAADGFLAIQAQDSTKLGDMITVIITLAEELLVEDAIIQRGQIFESLSKEGRWGELHGELNGLRDDLMNEMERMGDKDVALLVAAGGWLEGLRASAKTLETHYSDRASTLLYQPKLLRYFRTRFLSLPEEHRRDPAVQAIMANLDRMEQLVDVGFRTPIPLENVRELAQLAGKLVEQVEAGSAP